MYKRVVVLIPHATYDKWSSQESPECLSRTCVCVCVCVHSNTSMFTCTPGWRPHAQTYIPQYRTHQRCGEKQPICLLGETYWCLKCLRLFLDMMLAREPWYDWPRMPPRTQNHAYQLTRHTHAHDHQGHTPTLTLNILAMRIRCLHDLTIVVLPSRSPVSGQGVD